MRIASAAAEFGWTWAVGDVARFAAWVGWGTPTPDEDDPSVLYVTTNLDHGDPVAMFGADEHGEITAVAILLAAMPLHRPADALADTVAAMLGYCGPSVGPAHEDGTGAVWVLPQVVIKVAGGETVELILQNPARWNAPPPQRPRVNTRELERAGEGFLEHLESVIASNLGDRLEDLRQRSGLSAVLARRSLRGIWSRRDIDSVFKAFRLRPEQVDDGSLMAVYPQGPSLIAGRTPDRRQRYGYGEFFEVRLLEFVPPETVDRVYVWALERCIDRLGDPHQVGESNEFALWRLEHDTVRLTRGPNSESPLQVSVAPTLPSEREQHRGPHREPVIEPPAPRYEVRATPPLPPEPQLVDAHFTMWEHETEPIVYHRPKHSR